MIRDVIVDPVDKISAGVALLANAVKVTLGPQGKNVIISHPFRKPVVTKDGVTVAEEIHVEDPAESVAIQILKQAARQTCEEAGDGTTTATVLAEALYFGGLKAIESGVNPTKLHAGMQDAYRQVAAFLEANKMTVEGDVSVLKKVAAVAANNDAEIGELIGKAMNKVGHDGVIVVQEGRGEADELYFDEGAKLESGMLSVAFSNKNPWRTEYDHPDIIVCQKSINTAYDVVPFLEHAQRQGKPMLLICNEISQDALICIASNREKAQVCPVKAPDHAEFRRAIMDDMAIMCGAIVISPDMDLTLSTLGKEGNKPVESFVGTAERAIVSKSETIIIQGATNKDLRAAVEGRVAFIKEELEAAQHDYVKDKLQKRLARLSGGVGRLYIVAPTDAEMAQKKARVEDALFATRAAVDTGILPGGGMALLWAAREIESPDSYSDEGMGLRIVKDALAVPFRTIAENSNHDGGEMIARVAYDLGKVEGKFWLGYDFGARVLSVEPLYEKGIIDPVKVVLSALKNAISVAYLLLTTDVMVVNTPAQDEALEQNLRNRRG